MNIHNIYIRGKIRKNPEISLNICFLELLDELPRDSKTSSNQPR